MGYHLIEYTQHIHITFYICREHACVIVSFHIMHSVSFGSTSFYVKRNTDDPVLVGLDLLLSLIDVELFRWKCMRF